tara:strand:+ start:918 stop:1997 length:1080 start_codon:yes stop_codon:yes gene_type:complete
MAYFLGRDISVGISTEQPNYGINYASNALKISGTASATGDLLGAYDNEDFIPRRTATTEVSRIQFIHSTKADYESTASNNNYVLLYDTDGNKYLIWWNNGSGAKPTGLSEDFSQEVDISSTTASIADIRAATGTAIATDSDFAAAFTFVQSGVFIDITDKESGFATDIARGSGFTDSDIIVTTTTEGTGTSVANSVADNDELKIDDVVGIDFTLGALDEDIAYFGQRTALKAEIKKEVSIVLTMKKKNDAWTQLWNNARCGLRATTGAATLAAGSNNIEFDNSLTMPYHDGTNTSFGYRVYLELKAGTEVLSCPNMCMSEYSVSFNTDGVQEETITLYGNVTPSISTIPVVTDTARADF